MALIPPADSRPATTSSASEGPIDSVRSEERVRSRIETVGLERVRVEKYVVSEERTITVSVRREEVRISREPIASPEVIGGPRRTGSDLVIVLSEERPVVSMQVVPVERITVSTVPVGGVHEQAVELRQERVVLEES